MHVEYIGVNDRQVGTGTLHKVHAHWESTKTEKGEVKRAASAAVRKVVGKGGSVTFSSWTVGNYNAPRMDAAILVRVLTDAQVAARKELKSLRFTECEGPGADGKGCGKFPGQVVRMTDGTEQPLCFDCWNPMRGTGVKVMHYIQRDGRVQIN
jgi:hypothetical protein